MLRTASTLLILLMAWMPMGQAAMACCLAQASVDVAQASVDVAQASVEVATPCPGHLDMQSSAGMSDQTSSDQMSSDQFSSDQFSSATATADGCGHGAACSGVVGVITRITMPDVTPVSTHWAKRAPSSILVGTRDDPIRPPSTT